ncbi:MAG: hypothetical protein IPL96_16160 [Holophagaceae bacterium]|nr:hypothetical protein [Holophagaceae bacterium]
MVGLDLVEDGQGRFGLLLDLPLVPGHAQHRQGRVIAGWGGLDELVPGLEGLAVGLGGVGPFAGAEHFFRDVAVLGAKKDGREEGGNEKPEAGHGGVRESPIIAMPRPE